MTISDLLSLSYKSLVGNPLRSMLTILGVFMGVASVSATLQVGNIGQAMIERQLAEREAPQVTVYLWTKDGRKLRLEDMEFLKSRMAGLKSISTMIWFDYGQVIFNEHQAELSLNAVSPDYLLTSGRNILAGRFFSGADFDKYRSVAVIDQFLAEQLFVGQNPLGKRLYAAGKPYTIVGVMESKLKSEEDIPRGEILIPLSLYRVLLGTREIGSLQVRPQHLEDINQLQEQAEQLLLQRYPGAKFWAQNNVTDILQQRQTLTVVSQGMLVLGAISLAVGAAGIANITLASVTERTPEIGLRLAIGATQKDILLQFVLEATLLSVLGGILAIVTIHGVTLITAEQLKLPYHFQLETASLAIGSAFLVGVGSSFFPALQASQLDPVKALKSD
jgi:putative ABC transport system permease protein